MPETAQTDSVTIHLGEDPFTVTAKQLANIKRMVKQYLESEVRFNVGDIVEIDGRKGKILWATRSQMTPAVTTINVDSMKIFHVKDDGFIMNTETAVNVVGHALPDYNRKPIPGSAAPKPKKPAKQPKLVINLDEDED